MKIHDKDKNRENRKIDAIAEQWVNLVLAHIGAKKLSDKKLINIKNEYGHPQR